MTPKAKSVEFTCSTANQLGLQRQQATIESWLAVVSWRQINPFPMENQKVQNRFRFILISVLTKKKE